MIERVSRDIAAAYGPKFAHLRYFNAAGACRMKASANAMSRRPTPSR